MALSRREKSVSDSTNAVYDVGEVDLDADDDGSKIEAMDEDAVAHDKISTEDTATEERAPTPRSPRPVSGQRPQVRPDSSAGPSQSSLKPDEP